MGSGLADWQAESGPRLAAPYGVSQMTSGAQVSVIASDFCPTSLG